MARKFGRKPSAPEETGTEAAPITEVTTMDDIKKGFREAQESTKETWRNRDGESPSAWRCAIG